MRICDLISTKLIFIITLVIVYKKVGVFGRKQRAQLSFSAMTSDAVKARLSSLARESSLFSTASFHEHMKKKDSSSTSVLAMAQGPNHSDITNSKKRPRLVYENTYKLEPAVKFESGKVTKIIETVLEEQLKDEVYDQKSCKQMVLTLSEIIKSRVKDLAYHNYKLVCVVSIGELKEQGFRMGSRCCWDVKWDNFATGNYKNKSLFAIGTVWGLYYE